MCGCLASTVAKTSSGGWTSSGVLDERYDQVDDIVRARNVPSLQLAGYPDRRTIDLNSLTAIGVKLVGRLAGINDGKAQFSGSLRNVCALADLKMNRLLDTIDEWAAENAVDSPGRCATSLRTHRSRSVTAARNRSHAWANQDHHLGNRVPSRLFVARRAGRRPQGLYLVTTAGSSQAPGLYLLGMPFLRRRKSSLIDGVGDDARDLSAHLERYLNDRTFSSRPALQEL